MANGTELTVQIIMINTGLTPVAGIMTGITFSIGNQMVTRLVVMTCTAWLGYLTMAELNRIPVASVVTNVTLGSCYWMIPRFVSEMAAAAISRNIVVIKIRIPVTGCMAFFAPV
jgi:hypothetical protein